MRKFAKAQYDAIAERKNGSNFNFDECVGFSPMPTTERQESAKIPLMESEWIMLNPSWLKNRLMEVPDIKFGDIYVRVYKSNVPNSNTLYIELFFNGFKGATIRISDHFNSAKHQKQIIVDCTREMTEKRKKDFVRTLKNASELTRRRNLDYLLKKC